jgi:hypothetical protein
LFLLVLLSFRTNPRYKFDQVFDVMLQLISSPRGEAASPPSPRCTRSVNAVTLSALQFKTVSQDCLLAYFQAGEEEGRKSQIAVDFWCWACTSTSWIMGLYLARLMLGLYFHFLDHGLVPGPSRSSNIPRCKANPQTKKWVKMDRKWALNPSTSAATRHHPNCPLASDT